MQPQVLRGDKQGCTSWQPPATETNDSHLLKKSYNMFKWAELTVLATGAIISFIFPICTWHLNKARQAQFVLWIHYGWQGKLSSHRTMVSWQAHIVLKTSTTCCQFPQNTKAHISVIQSKYATGWVGTEPYRLTNRYLSKYHALWVPSRAHVGLQDTVHTVCAVCCLCVFAFV